MSATLALTLVLLSVVLCVAMAMALAVGYVPSRLHGPTNERIFCLGFGIGEGLLLAAVLSLWIGGRR